MNKIMVSVCVLSYNHEKYIRKCLDGIVMQNTSFPIEVWVHDDASTDSSGNIIKEYQQRYPDIIKPILQKQNQYSKGGGILVRHVFPKCNGKYIALCEGDDYWTDPLKLQKQVDFLEAHLNYSVCWHRCKRFYVKKNEWGDDQCGDLLRNNNGFDVTIPLFFKTWVTQPLAMMCRNESLYHYIHTQYKHYRDTYMIYHLLCEGKGYLLPFIGGVYNVTGEGVSSGLDSIQACQFELESANELYYVNRDKYTHQYWTDTVLWSLQTYRDIERYDLYWHLLGEEIKYFPLAVIPILCKRLKYRIKIWKKKI